MYFGLLMFQPDKPIANVMARTRFSELSKFSIKLLKSEMGRVRTPVPADASNFDYDNYNPEGLPEPIGKFHATVRSIAGARDTEKIQLEEVVETIRSETEVQEMHE